jgi:hypothetical protein
MEIPNSNSRIPTSKNPLLGVSDNLNYVELGVWILELPNFGENR